jgi:hypothetical protein
VLGVLPGGAVRQSWASPLQSAVLRSLGFHRCSVPGRGLFRRNLGIFCPMTNLLPQRRNRDESAASPTPSATLVQARAYDTSSMAPLEQESLLLADAPGWCGRKAVRGSVWESCPHSRGGKGLTALKEQCFHQFLGSSSSMLHGQPSQAGLRNKDCSPATMTMGTAVDLPSRGPMVSLS